MQCLVILKYNQKVTTGARVKAFAVNNNLRCLFCKLMRRSQPDPYRAVGFHQPVWYLTGSCVTTARTKLQMRFFWRLGNRPLFMGRGKKNYKSCHLSSQDKMLCVRRSTAWSNAEIRIRAQKKKKKDKYSSWAIWRWL